MDDPQPATQAPLAELEELLQWVRRELVLREEAPVGSWVEDSANELRTGRKPGWFYPVADGGGVAFYNARRGQAYAHVHVGPGPAAAEHARRLTESLLGALPGSIRAIDIGFSGLPTDLERTLLEALARRPGSTVIARRAMERALGPADGDPLPGTSRELAFVPVRRVTVEALAELDRRAFEGSVDALLTGTEIEDYRRVLEALLGGQFGRLLDEASTTLYRSEPPRLIAAILTTELSPRRAVFVEFLVDPEFRRQGLGRALLRWGLRALWALGYERVRLWVTDANVPARTLYESAGFRVTATAVIYRWDRPT